MIKRIAALLIAFAFAGDVPASNDLAEADINGKILQETSEHSQVMRIARILTDVYGPRLTGSPNFKAACDWTLNEMKDWGLSNPHLEAWYFGYEGWANQKCSVNVIAPYKSNLECEAVAWTPGTRGRIRAQAVLIAPPANPSAETLNRFMDGVKEKIYRKVVLVGEPKPVIVSSGVPPKRLEKDEIWKHIDPFGPDPCLAQAPELPRNEGKTLESWQVNELIDSLLLGNDVVAKMTDAERDDGQVAVLGARIQDVSKSVPGLVLRREDYGRIARTLASGSNIEMELEISNESYPEGKTSFNVIAEIPGTEKKKEMVMLGAHLDSWHGATGATDNAAGVSAMMEAMRILQKLGIRPRRTIRLALWGGEEQGLLGSKAYVEDHFGTYEKRKAEYSGLMAYLNMDSGTGRVRGAMVFGPPEAAAFIRGILKPFEDLGVVGAISSGNRIRGSTDSTSFNWAGLAGIWLQQDPLEYFTSTLHTNLDTFEHLSESDLKQCAIVAAALAYHLAMSEESLPKFGDYSMPKPGTNSGCR